MSSDESGTCLVEDLQFFEIFDRRHAELLYAIHAFFLSFREVHVKKHVVFFSEVSQILKVFA